MIGALLVVASTMGTLGGVITALIRETRTAVTSMRWFALTAFLAIAAGCGSSESPRPFNLTPPVRLIDTNAYRDGRTTCFALVDARAETLRGGFDGRTQLDEVTCPLHCFIGGDYPTEPGVRLLPLWGSEERQLVKLLGAVSIDTLSMNKARRDFAFARDGFVHVVEERRKTLEAIDLGLMASPDATHRLFAGADTSRAESLIRDHAANRFLVTFRKPDGQEIRIGFPDSPDSVMSLSLLSGERFVARHQAGSIADRWMMTLVTLALKDTPAPDVVSAIYERDRDALLEILRLRRSKILEADKGC